MYIIYTKQNKKKERKRKKNYKKKNTVTVVSQHDLPFSFPLSKKCSLAQIYIY